MDQSLVIAILVGLIVFLLGLLLLLVAASGVLVWNNRRLDHQRRNARRALAQARAKSVPVAPSPTPISRIAAPMPAFDLETTAADEAATEVIGAHHVAAFYGFEDEDTGTTEVLTSPLVAELLLDDTEETTKIGKAPGRAAGKKK